MRAMQDTVLCLVENSSWSFLILLFPLIRHKTHLSQKKMLGFYTYENVTLPSW